MSEQMIDEDMGRLVTIHMHQEQAGAGHALHHGCAAIDELTDMPARLRETGEPAGTA
ncbi:hypothetical protein [Novosphingobium rosa]|uniref:hypothetical protein n=1 Tax=Novosphingobium rosa TaxID=76978 RepID=UPI000B2663DB|nr:hypothetical protein [Novosphingobium rosa]